MARFELPFYAAMALLTGPVMFARGFRDLRTRRLIRNTPTARIRSMAMGLVEISGTVLERSRVRAPFSGRECAYWEVDVSVPMGRRGGHRVVHRQSSGNPFYLSDGTGIALVYPRGSTCKVPPGRQEDCVGIFMPDLYKQYMTEQGLWQRHLWRLGTVRFRERTLEEGQSVYVLGTAVPRAMSRDISSPTFAESATERAAPAEPALRATGTDGPGATAWDTIPMQAKVATWTNPALRRGAVIPVPVTPRASAIPLRGPGRVQALHDQISAVIRRGDHHRTFIISAESELALEVSYGISTVGNLFGGPLLTLFGLGYWIHALAGRHVFK